MAIQPSESGESSRRTRNALRESEERFRLMVEGVKDYAIFMLDAGGRISTWNSGARRIKGYEAGEIVGEHFSAFYTREDVKRGHPEQVLRLAAADGQYEEEGLRVRKDGSTFWANVVITALRNEAGDLRGSNLAPPSLLFSNGPQQMLSTLAMTSCGRGNCRGSTLGL